MSRYHWTPPAITDPTTQVELPDYHRRQITSLLAELAPASAGRLAILGAGPCNDLDLRQLQVKWPHIDLVDRDSDLVQQGIAAQTNSSTGLHVVRQDLLLGDAASRDPSTATDLLAPEVGHSLLTRIKQAGWDALRSDYDLVASTCLLSQLVHQVIAAVGADHALFIPTVQTLRQRHLWLMAQALRPGGHGLLFCDFVSSETLPELFQANPENLPGLLGQALQQNNFFHGLNPGKILQVAREDAALQACIDQVQMSPPWVWFTGALAYAVVVIKFTRRLSKDPTK